MKCFHFVIIVLNVKISLVPLAKKIKIKSLYSNLPKSKSALKYL